jgi:hypothetical protein
LHFPDLSSGSRSRVQSCSHCRPALPQSSAFKSDVLNVFVSYRLRAVVERPGILKSNVIAIRSVEFHPLLPPVPSLVEELGPDETTRHSSAVYLGVNKDRVAGEGNIPPPYSPSVMFEVGLPASKTIRPGDFLKLSMAFSIPVELQQLLAPILLFGLTIRLKTVTTAIVKSHRRSHVGYIDVCNVNGLLPLEISPNNTHINIPPELWQHHIFPTVIPSFQLCGAGRSHQLEIFVGFACRSTDKICVRKYPHII